MRLEFGVARYFLGTLERAKMAELASLSRDFRRTDEEGLTPLAATVLAEFDGPLRLQARQLATWQFLEQGRYQRFLFHLAEVLRRHQLSGVLLKGAGLLQTVYRKNPGIRPLGDIDLLVRASDFERVDRALRQEGFETPTPLQYGLGPYWVDLHLDLLNTHRIPARSLAFAVDSDDFTAASLALEGPLEGLRVPHPIDQFVHLSVHALKHSHGRLFWLVDLALVLAQCPWTDLMERAKQTRTQRPVLYSLVLLHRLLQVPVPAHPPSSWLERLYLEHTSRRPGDSFWGEVVTCLSIEGLGKRLTYLSQLFWPQSGEGGWPRLVRLSRKWWLRHFSESSSPETVSVGSQLQGR